MSDPFPNPPSTAPRDRAFVALFSTDKGPAIELARFENGKLLWKIHGQWRQTAKRDLLREWAPGDETIIKMGFCKL